MEVKSVKPSHRGNQIQFGKEIIKFDNDGVTRVKDDIGQSMLNKFPDTFYVGDELPKVDEKKIEQEEKKVQSDKEIALKKQLDESIDRVKELEDKVVELEDSVVSEINDDDLNIVYDIITDTKTNLLKACDSLGIPKEQTKDMNHKQIAIMLVKKTLNGDEVVEEEAESTEDQSE